MNAELVGRLNTALSHLIGDVLGRDWRGDLRNPPPVAFALQGLMRTAAVSGDIDTIAQLHTDHGHLLRDAALGARCQVVVFGDPVFDTSAHMVLQAGFGDDIGLTENLTAPDSADTLAAIAEINALGPLLAAHVPLWWAELQALLGTIILATTTKTGKGFAGASAFDVWGAILINPAYRSDRLHLALTLVHESSHLKLFYAYLDDEIVLNAPEQVFSSPLRRTPRPMNGIYHAAFVLARMALFVADIGRAKAGARLFGDGANRALQDELARSISNFDSAYAIIREQGVLTEKGQQIIAEAAAGVDECRALSWPT
jgi:hypothetical protein